MTLKIKRSCLYFFLIWNLAQLFQSPCPKAPKDPSPHVITIPLSLENTEKPSPAPILIHAGFVFIGNIQIMINYLVIDFPLSASTHKGLALHVSSSPCPSCPFLPSPQVKTNPSAVRTTMWVLETATCWILDLGGSCTGVKDIELSYPVKKIYRDLLA